MSRATVILDSHASRERAAAWARNAPSGTSVTFKQNKRSVPQNDRLWAHLTDIAQQKDWHGVRLEKEDWKLIFMDALSREARLVPNLDGNGFVALGRSSSNLTKQEMADLITLIEAWAAQNGVVLQDREAA